LTIAAALVHSPSLLFLDEPTVGLDVMAARSLRDLIAELRQQGITVFLTTHYLEEADLLCDRIAVLVKGRLVKTDSPEMLKRSIQERPSIDISFAGEEPRFVEELSKRLPNLQVMMSDHKVRIYGGDPAQVLQMVLQVAKEFGVTIDSVASIKPTLEDAFVKITGLAPTVMAVEKGGRR
jgi:ABC-2 type transport system ATP-binding protein